MSQLHGKRRERFTTELVGGNYRAEQLTLMVGMLREDGLRRGLTGSLFLLPYTEDARVFALRWYAADSVLCELACAASCRALFGHDAPGIYDLRVAPAPAGSAAVLNEDEIGESVKVGPELQLYVAKTFRADTSAMRDDALRRGVTATLFLLPLSDQSLRAVVYLNHASETIMYEVLRADGCISLFGCEAPGSYDLCITRAPHDPGICEDG